VAPDVHCLGPSGRTQTNVYLARAGGSWVLIDAGWENDADRIEWAVARVCGAQRPVAILLTHCHPDHAGAAPALARRWGCEVHMHPSELPIAQGDFAAMVQQAGPLDHFVILPVMRALGRRRREAAVTRSRLGDVARAIDPDGAVPGLPGWRAVPTPGHTPGHLSFLRTEDRVLISGDALVTLQVNSIAGFAVQRQGLSGPPWYTTWDRAAAQHSIAALADLDPTVVAGGHGWPVAGAPKAAQLRDFARAGGPLRPMTGELYVDRPVEEVFDMAADEPSWNPAMTSVRWLTPPPVGTGTRFVATMGGRLEMMVEITGFDRPHEIRTYTHSAMMTTIGTVSFQPVGAGTLIRWDWGYRLHGPSRLMTPAFAAFAGRWELANWIRMRDLLEARSGPRPTPPVKRIG
jgi:glyoxylase-like metal-dependent hydrolase (beta-lactamase superfamily II)